MNSTTMNSTTLTPSLTLTTLTAAIATTTTLPTPYTISPTPTSPPASTEISRGIEDPPIPTYKHIPPVAWFIFFLIVMILLLSLYQVVKYRIKTARRMRAGLAGRGRGGGDVELVAEVGGKSDAASSASSVSLASVNNPGSGNIQRPYNPNLNPGSYASSPAYPAYPSHASHPASAATNSSTSLSSFSSINTTPGTFRNNSIFDAKAKQKLKEKILKKAAEARVRDRGVVVGAGVVAGLGMGVGDTSGTAQEGDVDGIRRMERVYNDAGRRYS
ncbi:hypothetical protein BZA77DRAFT_360199 [Pyronema omphalodes]|nr:hypothetical protein BZA77DRAFT_360199 [Pyronema omphalodes]